MIFELIEYALTPCSWSARRLGFLNSSLQVRARFERCRDAWQEHLQRTRAAILQAAHMASGRRRAVILGAGLVHDIPVADLALQFEEVCLVDIVHTLSCRWAARRFKNVRLIPLDVTGVMAELPRLRKHPAGVLPRSEPKAFLEDDRLDYFVSVNVLSQLPWVPGRYLGGTRAADEIEQWKKHLVEAHLEYLQALPGHVALISDTRWRAESVGRLESESRLPEEWDVLQGIPLPEPDHFWDWRIAPAPEREAARDFSARVHAYLDWKRSAAGRGRDLGAPRGA